MQFKPIPIYFIGQSELVVVRDSGGAAGIFSEVVGALSGAEWMWTHPEPAEKVLFNSTFSYANKKRLLRNFCFATAP